MIDAGEFYADPIDGLRQGDILLSGLSRIVGPDPYTPPQWETLDTHHVQIDRAKSDGSSLGVAVGMSLVMVASHDCQLEKEWNRRRTELISAGMSTDDASERADADPDLDRTIVASPLVDPDDLDVDAGNLRSGRVVGYVPVPASPDGLVPDCVVDLTYRATIDRTDVVRVASLSPLARTQLRYALIRLDALRTPKLGFDVERVIGQSIERVDVSAKNPLTVHLRLSDGTVIALLQQPTEPVGGPTASR